MTKIVLLIIALCQIGGAAGAWNTSWGSTSPTGDYVAEAATDLIGVDLIVIVTQTSGCDSQLIAKGF